MTAVHAVMSSPIGLLTLVADGGALTAVYMENHKRGPAADSLGAAVLLDATASASATSSASASASASASDTATPDALDTATDARDAATGILLRTRVQLGEYFAGERREFDLPLAPVGNPFRQRVWSLLREIPYGQTRSYGDLARQLGDRNLAQAVGAGNARNPVSIIVPCHRVVGAAGQLTGYAGGLDRKHFLLGLEDPRRVQDALF